MRIDPIGSPAEIANCRCMLTPVDSEGNPLPGAITDDMLPDDSGIWNDDDGASPSRSYGNMYDSDI